MTNKTIQVKKLYWGWEDDKEENWLREMANQGWHLLKSEWGLYTFQSGEPADIVYRLDYITTNDPTERESYLQVFRDAGWEFVNDLLGWQYFRKPYQPGEQNEIYSDSASKIEKYKRLLLLMAGILPISLITLVNLPTRSMIASMIIGILVSLILIVQVFITFKVWNRIQQLKKPKI